MQKFDVLEYLIIRKEFLNFIAEVNGVIIDASKAFKLLFAQQLKEQDNFDKRRNADGEFETFEEGAWYTVNEHIMKRSTQRGSNRTFIGNYCIVTIYQFWEENIRPRIADVFGIEKNEIKHPVLGDVRNIRNAIIGMVQKPIKLA